MYINYYINMPYDQLKLKNQICHRLYMASNGITRIYRPFLKPLGITYPQYVVMMALWEEDQITMGSLSGTTKIDKGFLATTIDKLSTLGLVKVNVDMHDKRKKIILVTTKGKKIEERAKDIPHKILQYFDADPANEREALELIRLLDKINLKLATQEDKF